MDDAAVAALERAMAAAAAAGDYEQAALLRDELHAARNGGIPVAAVGMAGLTRQQPGAMGLGTSQQRAEPPPGWVRPKKPDPMTRGTSRRGRKPSA